MWVNVKETYVVNGSTLFKNNNNNNNNKLVLTVFN